MRRNCPSVLVRRCVLYYSRTYAWFSWINVPSYCIIQIRSFKLVFVYTSCLIVLLYACCNWKIWKIYVCGFEASVLNKNRIYMKMLVCKIISLRATKSVFENTNVFMWHGYVVHDQCKKIYQLFLYVLQSRLKNCLLKMWHTLDKKLTYPELLPKELLMKSYCLFNGKNKPLFSLMWI